MTDTIAAIATPMVPSAIGILRLSGPGAVPAVDQVFTPFCGGSMSQRPDRALVYGALRDRDGAVIDRCLCTVSRAPRSYTGEDTAELQCHGSPAALGKKTELWEYLRTVDRGLYHKLKYRSVSMVGNIPGYQGRRLSVSLYRMARKIYKFN